MKTADGKSELPVMYLDIETNELAEEVGGWGNVHLLTMGVAVTYNEAEPAGKEVRIWLAGMEKELCNYLRQAQCLVGHNLFRFDLTVLWGALNRAERLPIALVDMRNEKPDRAKQGWAGIPVIDTLATLKEATGRFVSLDNLGMSTLRKGKTEGMDGALAPVMLREGRKREVVAYCKDDVTLVRDLFRYGVTKGVVWYVDTRSRKPRYARPGWQESFQQLARVKGERVKGKRKR